MSHLQLYKGPESKIEKIKIVDGQMMFATDTKTIYLDCDFTDGNNKKVYGRFPFGGGAAGKGIIFAEAKFEETANRFFFTTKHIQVQPGEVAKLPDIDNVIFNIEDGYFYRVINKSTDQVEAERLNTVGTGGGEGGGGATGITALMITSSELHVAHDVKSIPITFAARSRQENAILDAALYINGDQVDTFKNIPQSQDYETNLFTFDVINYKDRLLQQDENTIEIFLSDNWGYSYKVPLTWKLSLYQVNLSFLYDDIGTQYGPFSYSVVPSFSSKLLNPVIDYEIIYTPQNSTTLIERKELSNFTSASVDIEVPARALKFAGAYRINLILSATIQGGATISSKVLSADFVYQISGSEQATIIGNFPEGGTYDLYDSVDIKYRLSYSRSAKVKKSIIIQNDSGTEILDNFSIDELNPDIWISWNVSFTKKGYYTFKLELLDSNNTTLQVLESTNTYLVEDKGLAVPPLETNNLIINLVPTKLNSSVDKEEWISNTPAGGEIKCELTGFNWNSNGWELETYKDSQGVEKSINCLHLNNGAKVKIPYNPWATSTANPSYGAEARGLTIEFDVKIKNIQKKYQRLISCVSENTDTNTLYTGIIANGESFTLNSRAKQPIVDLEDTTKRFTDKTKSGLVAYYTEDERVHVSYVINPRSVAESVQGIIPTRVAFTYINGVISGIVNYSETDKFLHDHLNQTSTPEIVFDSSGADIYIYNFRLYNTYLDSATLIKNYFATLGDYTEAARRWERNNLLNSNNEISLSAVKKVGTIPYLVIRGGQQCSEVKDENGDKHWKATAGGKVGLPYESKKDYRLIDAYFYDTDDTKNHIGDKDNRAKMIMYPQGTSSLIYPVKNLRIEFIDGQKYSLMEGLPEVDLFTLKADYMESSGAHNIGAANALNDLYESIGLKTPAQEIDPNYVTAIKGRPIVVFYKAVSEEQLADPNYKETDDDYQFVGKYNFNLDKATPEPFGFFSDIENKYGVVLDKDGKVKSGFIAASGEEQDSTKVYYTKPILSPEYIWDGKPNWKTYIESVGPLYEYHTAQEGIGSIQCWEVCTNTSDLVRFQIPWHEMEYLPQPEVDENTDEYRAWQEQTKAREANMEVWLDAFESRYPEYEEEVCSDKRGMMRLLNWVASTNILTATNLPLEEGCDLSSKDSVTEKQTHYNYTTDSKAYRLAKFEQEAPSYLLLDFMAFYYVMTEVNYMIDSRAKNMMLCSFDQDMDAGTGHWFPIFYDMDTQLGVDNEGKIRFLYDDEDYEFGKFNTLANYNNLITGEPNGGVVNILWSNFVTCFKSNIQNMYLKLRSGQLNAKNLLRIYNDGQADAWDEVFCNEDAEYKYLRPFLSGEMTEEMEKEDGSNQNSANRLYASQGTRTLHRTKFIKSRLNYLDSKYQYNGTSRWEMRAFSPANPPADWDPKELTRFNLTAKDTVYVNYGTEGDDIGYSGLRIEEGTTGVLQVPMPDEATEQSIYLYSGQAYSDLGDLSTKYLGNISYDDKSDENSGSELIKFQFSPKDLNRKYYEEPADVVLSELNVLKAAPLIEEFWLQNTRYSADVNLNKCYYLKNVYCAGSPIKDITFPDGGVLENVQLPSTVNEIKIKGHQNLKDLTVLTFRDLDNTADKSKTNKEDWSTITSFSIEDCDQLDTKTIFSKLNQSVGISLPDINWTIEPFEDECVLEEDTVIVKKEDGSTEEKTVRIIKEIPILEKLRKTRGISESDSDINALNRTYVAGNIHIKNGDYDDIGIDEVLLYDLYQKYYPLLTFSFDHSNANIEGFSFNVYSSTSDLMADKSKKFKANELSSKFTLANTFGDTSDILIPVQNLNLLPRYATEFVGWNLEGRKEFYEDRDTYDPNATVEENIAAAREAANQVTAIRYDPTTGLYSVNNGFDFATAFNDEVDTLNFYPTFVATVQSYEVTFYDGLTLDNDGYGNILKVNINGVEQNSQMVRHSEQPVMPFIIPQRVELPEQKSQGRVYLFKAYNNVYTYENKPTIVTNSQFKASYNSTYVNIWETESSEGYFSATTMPSGGVSLSIKPSCTEEALTIPTKYQGKNVEGLTSSSNTVKRIFFKDDNVIKTIGKGFKSNDKNFEYIQFSQLSNLISIEDNAFQKCSNLEVTVLPDSITNIGSYAFAECSNVSISALPQWLVKIGQSAFQSCIGLKDLDFSKACSVKYIDGVEVALTEIGQSAFQYCSNLKILKDQYDQQLSGIITILGSAFQECTSLGLVINNDDSFKTIGANAFAGADIALNALPDGVEKIGTFAFGNLPNNVTNIGIIPESVVQIDSYAFANLTFDTDILEIRSMNFNGQGISDNAFSTAYIQKIQIPREADTSVAPWASGVSNSWGATINIGGGKTPLVRPDGSEVV